MCNRGPWLPESGERAVSRGPLCVTLWDQRNAVAAPKDAIKRVVALNNHVPVPILMLDRDPRDREREDP